MMIHGIHAIVPTMPEIYRFTGAVQFTTRGFTHEHIPGDFKKTKVTCVLCCLPCR